MQNYTDDIFNQRFAEMMHLKYGKFPSEVVCCPFLLLRFACISFEGCMRYSASGFMIYKQTCLPQFNEFLQGECYRERVSADFQVSCKVACMNMGEKARGGARIKVGFCKRLWLLRFKKFVVFSRRVFDYIATFYIWIWLSHAYFWIIVFHFQCKQEGVDVRLYNGQFGNGFFPAYGFST